MAPTTKTSFPVLVLLEPVEPPGVRSVTFGTCALMSLHLGYSSFDPLYLQSRFFKPSGVTLDVRCDLVNKRACKNKAEHPSPTAKAKSSGNITGTQFIERLQPVFHWHS